MTDKHLKHAGGKQGEGRPDTVGYKNAGVGMKQVHAFLEHWPLVRARATFAAQRENTVYRVDTAQGKSYALRIRRVGYRTEREIYSELDWMAMLAAEGLHVPLPVNAKDGRRLVCVGNLRADLVTWLNGKPLGGSGQPLTLANPVSTFRTLGRVTAKLHLLSDQWILPKGFERPKWNNDALLGEAPLWGRFWDCAGLTTSDAALFNRFREAARVKLTNVHDSLDAGLIHADLVGENILLQATDPNTIGLIDFDDSVFGYRLFELATALGKNVEHSQFPALREALISGYRELRPIDTSDLDLFMAIRAATYVGWSAARKTEPGGDARANRAVNSARLAATYWLNTIQH